jgi:hypothetical protein
VTRRVVTPAVAFSRSSRPDQLHGLLERAGFTDLPLANDYAGTKTPPGNGLRLATEV